jgi:hypothetical protein
VIFSASSFQSQNLYSAFFKIDVQFHAKSLASAVVNASLIFFKGRAYKD